MHTKTDKKKKDKNHIKKSKKGYPDELIQEVKESLEDFKTGKFFKGNVNDIMKAIRDRKGEADRNREIC